MRIYLSATQDVYGGLVHLNVPRLLVSFKSNADKFPAALRAAGNPADWCVDSGAHFFLSAYYKKNIKLPIAVVEAHMRKFVAAVEAFNPKPAFVVELDLQDLYGSDQVEQWREDVWWPLEQRTGIKVVYVWHHTDSPGTWERMVADPDMHFLGTPFAAALPLEVRLRMVLQAYEAGKPVHGFACVRPAYIKHVPYYSVDSTSWGAAAMFGLSSRFNMQKGGVTNASCGISAFKHDKRAAIGNALTKSSGVMHVSDLLDHKDGAAVSRQYQDAVQAYGEMETFYTAYWRNRGIDWNKRLNETP